MLHIREVPQAVAGEPRRFHLRDDRGSSRRTGSDSLRGITSERRVAASNQLLREETSPAVSGVSRKGLQSIGLGAFQSDRRSRTAPGMR